MADDPTAAQVLVGRDAELADLSTAVGLTDGASAHGVLLGGDAGIGKTRLLRALARRAADAGSLVLVGHCLDLGDGGLPYQPFAGALAALAPDQRGQLVAALPSLGVLLPGGAGADAVERGSLFSSVAAALELLAVDREVVLVIEDAHWADASTRHLLRYLLAQPTERPLHLLISYRTDDLHRRHPLRSALAEWTRLPGVRRLELEPLADSDVARLVQSRSGGALAARGVGVLVERARGNAFFAEELLDAGLADRDAPLPETLADLLLLRLERLDPEARRLVQIAAVTDGSESWAALAEVSGLTSAALDAALAAAVDHKVLRRVGPDDYRFRHALLGEAVRDDLLPGERRRIHDGFLAALPPDTPAASVARHALAVGARETAFAASVRAAEEAARLSGHDEAARHYEQALDLVDAAPADLDLTALVIAAGDALVTSGQFDRALRLLQDQLDRTPTDAPDDHAARLLVGLGNTHYLLGDDQSAGRRATEAAALTGDDSSLLAAEVLALSARVAAQDRERLDEAIRLSEQAVSIGEQVNAPDVVLDARATLTRLMVRAGHDRGRAQQDFGDLIQVARATGDVFGELRALQQLAFLFFNAGDLDRAAETFSSGMRRAAATGWGWGPYGFDGRFFGALVAYLQGRWDDVVELCRAPAGAPEFAAGSLAAIELLVAAGRGDLSALERTRHLHTIWRRDVSAAIHSSTAMVDLYGHAGDLSAARRAHDTLIEWQVDGWNEPDFPARIRLAALLTGQVGASIGSTSRVARAELLQLVDQLEADVQRVADAQAPLGPEGLAWQVRAAAEGHRARHAGGLEVDTAVWVASWREAHAAFVALGDPYEAARSATRLAAALHATGRETEVPPLLASARADATALGAAPLLREIDALEPSRVAADTVLTPREHEVLQQVAAGLSNGEIGKRLFISTKTVSVHVSNILAKLGAAGRTEAAAIARRNGLLDDS